MVDAAKSGAAGDTTYPVAAKSGAAEDTTHKVIAGDTLSGLAKTYCGEEDLWPIIYEKNQAVIGFDPNKDQDWDASGNTSKGEANGGTDQAGKTNGASGVRAWTFGGYAAAVSAGRIGRAFGS